ncbi:MAG: methylenetetrahydrofolate reductase [Salinibacterium sp.]|nr:methylenetetrahydrofolate reductase [Salinibacterium sp.]
MTGEAACPTFSFELYPPRTEVAESRLFQCIDKLSAVSPEFISVTYRPTGSDRAASLAVLGKLIREHRVRAMAHLTCVGSSYEEASQVIREFLDEGVTSFLALRGDPPPGMSDDDAFLGDFASAAELVQLIHHVQAERSPFSFAEMRGFPTAKRLHSGEKVTIAVAAFPNGHPRSRSRGQDIDTLLAKQAAGANLAITQLFFISDEFHGFVAEAREAGVTMRILPGIMPVMSVSRLRRVLELSGERTPRGLLSDLESAAGAPAAARVGIDAATGLARELVAGGADGIHLYTFNSSDAPLAVLAGAGLLGASTPSR